MKNINILSNIKNFIYCIIDKFPALILNDKVYIKIQWKRRMGYPLNLKEPKTYNEKLQWLKLYDHKDIYTTLVDKFAVKEYVKKIIGEDYIIPTLGLWNNFNDIDLTKLPNQFVLKCTHDSGGLVICRNKKLFNKNYAKRKINNCLSRNFYLLGREWPYKNVPHRIIAEKYMEDKELGELRDYKFFCFNGEPKWMFIATERQKNQEPYFDFFDMQFNHLHLMHGHPNAPITPMKPNNFELMKTIASKLSQNIPHVRVDLYEINGKVYFGEMTFFHHSGFVPFHPNAWDEIFGKEIHLK